jgi:hypothetical protein
MCVRSVFMSAQELYDVVRALPAMEQLRLASRILDDLTASKGLGLDISDHWSGEDMTDLAAFGADHAGLSAEGEEPHA